LNNPDFQHRGWGCHEVQNAVDSLASDDERDEDDEILEKFDLSLELKFKTSVGRQLMQAGC
jgi:hypothetical protein